MLLGGVLLLLEHIYFKFFRRKLRKWDTCGCCGLVSLVSIHTAWFAMFIASRELLDTMQDTYLKGIMSKLRISINPEKFGSFMCAQSIWVYMYTVSVVLCKFC